MTFAATIIAPQSSGAGACNPVNANITDAGYNLDVDGTCISPDAPATGSHAGSSAYGSSTYGAVLDAYLADGLANNGGPTRTLALLNTPNPATTLADPAFDVVPAGFALPVAVGGVSAACSVSDQRGVVPAAGANCAIGAYQLQATKTALAASSATVEQNAPVTYTATVAPGPDGGTVTFDDGAGNPATAHCAAQPVSNGTATCTVSYADTGSYPVAATYSGDGASNNFAASASTPQTVVVGATPPPAPPALTFSKVTVTRCMGTGKGARKNVTVGYTLSGPARVTFTLQRAVKSPRATRTTCPRALPPGKYVNVRRSGARAVTPSSALTAQAKKSVLRTTVSVAAGAHTFQLKKLLGSTTLKPGRYRVRMQAVGSAGAKAQDAAYFWALKARKKG